MSDMMVLPGYKISEIISKNINKVIYRGVRTDNKLPVIMIKPKDDYFFIEAVSKLKHEYNILQSIKSQAIVSIVELAKNGKEPVLVVEDYGGIPLELYLKMKLPKMKEMISLSIQIAECIGEVHQQGIIHKSINPGNILINPDTREVKLIDFGSATRISHEYQPVMNLKELEESARYVSPEQTGRMNRGVDYRTDLYSFGATMYEMFTGKPPHASNDLLELVHAHIAQNPVRPHEINKAIPEMLSSIITKCLAKNAEDRYNSMAGLAVDLRECLDQLQQTGVVNSFPLARHDQSDRLYIPQKLYGREQDIQVLIQEFEHVSSGATRFLLVSGSAGIGKSALINEVQKAQVRSKFRYISGKFDQFKQNIPYVAIIQAFQELIRQLLMESTNELEEWRDAILEAVQGLGQVIVDVLPQLEMIIGKQPPVTELPPAESKNRFQMVMQRFVRVFARPEQPLVLFLDDLQWADTASVLLIQQIITDLQVSHLLLIGAYRSQEGSTGNQHMAMLTLDSNQSGIMQQITLQPLQLPEINQLLADTLHTSLQDTNPLARIIEQKTEGNPFFVREFLRSLYDMEMLVYREDERRWNWQLEQIEKLSTADNVADFLVAKVMQLPYDTQQILATAACLGNTFFLQMVANACGRKESLAIQHIWPAIQEGLLYPLEGERYIAYVADEEVLPEQVRIQFKFVHDRIQQAAYSLLTDAERKKVHLKVGRILQTILPAAGMDETLFEMCDHLYLAEELILDDAEKYQSARLHLLAGQKAKLSTAYDAALKYLRHGIKLLPSGAWEQNQELTIELYTLQAEAEYLCNNFEEAERLFEIALQNVKTNTQQVMIHEIQLHMYTSLANFPLVMELANQALRLLDVDIPINPGKLAIIKEMWQVQRRVKKYPPEQFLALPNLTEENYKTAMKIISYAGPSSYFVNQNWFALTILRVLHLSLKHGNSVDSANGYTGYGIVLSSKFRNYKAGHEFGLLACQIAEKFNDPLAITKAYGAFAILLNHWRSHAKNNIILLKKAIQHGLDSGSNIYGAYNSLGLLDAMLFCGFTLEEIKNQIQRYSGLIHQIKVVDHDDRLLLLHQALDCLTRKHDDQPAFHENGFNEPEYVKDLQENGKGYKRYIYSFYKFQMLYLFEQYREAAELAHQAEEWIESVNSQVLEPQHLFMQSLALTASFSQASPEKKQSYSKKIKAALKKMKVWAQNCPENFQHKYLLMDAEWAYLQGKHQEAATQYEQSVQAARRDGFVQNEAIACEQAAKFYLATGMETIAKVYMNDAYNAYLQWGATAKAEDLAKKYSHLLNRTITKEGEQPSSIIDLMTVIKASHTIASEIRLEKLIATMLRTVISNAGAQKGLLILKTGSEWVIEAAGYGDHEVESMQSIPYEQSDQLSVAIVNYTIRTEKMLVVHNATKDEKYLGDSYIERNKPQSVLCSPLWQQGKMIGIIYLENNLATHVFNEERTELLRLIFSQIAIFIENARLYHQLEKWNDSLGKIVEERTDEIQKLLQANKNLLDNAGQGFLLFSNDLVVHSEYSLECLRIFGKEIAGVSVAELLYPDKPEEREFIESLLLNYFDADNQMQKELYLGLLPTEITVNKIPVKLECKQLQVASEEFPEGLMLILTDLSEKRALESKMEAEWQILKMVVSIVTNFDLFQGTLRNYTAFYHSAVESMRSSEGAEFQQQLFKILGQVHQFKGDFSQLHLVHTPPKLHDLETELVELMRETKNLTLDQVRERIQIEPILDAMQQDLLIVKQKLGDDFFKQKEQVITFTKDRWNQFETSLTQHLLEENKHELRNKFRQLHFRPVHELVSRYKESASNLAVRLGKNVHPLQMEGAEVWIDPNRYGSFVSSLIHVFRNAIDHGIESEAERLILNKDISGTVSCKINQEGNTLTLAIKDDGRGIDLDLLKAKSYEKGLIDLEQAATWTDQRWLEQIFADEFSLKEEINEISGRGVGLSVVKREVNKLSGTVRVESSKGEGTTFFFSIPLADEDRSEYVS